MPKIIIGFTGLIACGKDVSKKYLENNYGAECYRFSTILRDVLGRLYLPINRENLQDLSTILRQRFGEDLLAKIITDDVRHSQREIVVVDGIRRDADISYLKQLPNFHLVSIEVDDMTRYRRMVARNENEGDSAKSFEQFLADGKKETELEIPAVMSEAAYHLDNNKSLEDLYRQIDELIIKLEKI